MRSQHFLHVLHVLPANARLQQGDTTDFWLCSQRVNITRRQLMLVWGTTRKKKKRIRQGQAVARLCKGRTQSPCTEIRQRVLLRSILLLASCCGVLWCQQNLQYIYIYILYFDLRVVCARCQANNSTQPSLHTQDRRLRPKTTTLPHSTTPVFVNSFIY